MKQLIFSVRDELKGFGSLFLAPSDAFAKRDFSCAVNQHEGSSALAYAPNDFALFRLGTFDLDKGSFELEPVPVMICRGGSLIADEKG